MRRLQTVDKKLFSPPPKGGRIALSANERIAEFLDFAIQAKFAYVNKLQGGVYHAPPCLQREKTTWLKSRAFGRAICDDLLGIACETVREIQLMSSGKMVYLECEDVLPLTSFYERNGFFRFANRNLDGDERDLSQTPYLVQMIKYFKDA